MTREEAIRCLSVHSSTNGSGLCTDKQHYEAKQMAIKALEQELCEDMAKERYEDLCEYFGKAKDILKNREDFKAWLGRVRWHIRKAEELSAENNDLRDQLAMRDRFQKANMVVKEPIYQCSCYATYPNKHHKNKNGNWKCIDKYKPIKFKRKWRYGPITKCVRVEPQERSGEE